jgi:hypothetical protein
MVATGELKNTSSRFRAWIYEFLAANHFQILTPDSLGFTLARRELVKSYVQRSLQEDINIWPEHVDNIRIPNEVRVLYQECWDEIYKNFVNKRKSWRVGVGTIMRADLGYSLGFLDVAGGIGVALVDAFVDPETAELQSPTNPQFTDLLLFVRLQKMRKNLKRFTAGGYLEYSLLKDLTQSDAPFAHALSIGPVVGYAYPSGWEIGGSFEFARLIIGRESQEQSQQLTSQLITIDEGSGMFVSYGYFEIYIRKWF